MSKSNKNKCPYCETKLIGSRYALSRVDNVHICPQCGTLEAMADFATRSLTDDAITQWEIKIGEQSYVKIYSDVEGKKIRGEALIDGELIHLAEAATYLIYHKIKGFKHQKKLRKGKNSGRVNR